MSACPVRWRGNVCEPRLSPAGRASWWRAVLTVRGAVFTVWGALNLQVEVSWVSAWTQAAGVPGTWRALAEADYGVEGKDHPCKICKLGPAADF